MSVLTPVRVARRAAWRPIRWMQEQVAREQQAQLVAQLALLDHPCRPTWRGSLLVPARSPLSRPADPLEQLWALPAARRGS